MGAMELTVAVLGAGAMGSGIAQVAAAAGEDVWLVDAVADAAIRARTRIGTSLAQRVDRGALSAADAEATVARLHVADDLTDLPECAIVVEAVVEDLHVKAALLAALAEHQPATTILATNTSSLDVSAIAEQVSEPERVLGLHFFNPPPAMKLVEVVRGVDTAPWIVEYCTALMREWGKTPVVCASTPGFIVNRVARPFYGEAQRMVMARSPKRRPSTRACGPAASPWARSS
jgi:3-hydroxybutyryl-CoA dehydrogenase